MIGITEKHIWHGRTPDGGDLVAGWERGGGGGARRRVAKRYLNSNLSKSSFLSKTTIFERI